MEERGREDFYSCGVVKVFLKEEEEEGKDVGEILKGGAALSRVEIYVSVLGGGLQGSGRTTRKAWQGSDGNFRSRERQRASTYTKDGKPKYQIFVTPGDW
jgi:hypothetical protein